MQNTKASYKAILIFIKMEGSQSDSSNWKKRFTKTNICIADPGKVEKENCTSKKLYKKREEVKFEAIMDSRQVYLQKKIREKLEPPTKENTELVLLSIVLLFILTHSFRLAIKIYEVILPNGNNSGHFEECYSLGR